MSTDISEEAKKAIADVSRRKAVDRLQRDGCCSMDAVRRRVRAFAQERNLQPAEFAKLMHKRVSTPHAIAFCKKHKVSLDWLLYGNLQGLQRMMQERRMGKMPTTPERIREKLARLSESEREIISKKVDELLEDQ
jgi:hypothetical protein